MNFTILIELLSLFAFTYFLVLPVSLSYIVERIIVNGLRQLRNGIAMALELTPFVRRAGGQIAPPEAPRTKPSNFRKIPL